MSEFAPVLVVSALNGTNGYRLDGDAAGDFSGRAVSGGGDINGDGFDDLLIGAPRTDTGGTDRGFAWVVFGAASAPPAQGLMARVSAGTAYRFQGEPYSAGQAGFSVHSAGDVNGDGFDDLLIGAPYEDPDVAGVNRGATYLVFGRTAKLEGFDAADGVNDNFCSLFNLTAAAGYRFDGAANGDESGLSVSGGGDINGDGFADLIVGAPLADLDGGSGNGASTIVFGGTANLSALDGADIGGADGKIDLANVGTGSGVRLDGETINTYDVSGRSVAQVGDVNGDGFADVLVGAPQADPHGPYSGSAYLVFGQPGLPANIDLAGDDGVNQVRFDGVAAGDQAGRAVNGAGDVNGDGLADLVIGAPYADPHGEGSGSAYVVFGRTVFSGAVDLASLDGSDGFRLDGLRANDRTGISVASAGDVNGDGFDDLAIAARFFDRLGAKDAGALYIVFGKASGFAPVVNLGSLVGNDGFRIEGAAANQLGPGVQGPAGDVNGDGFDDIVAGAPYSDGGGTNSGSTYVIYGHRADTAVTRVGTDFDNTINGGKGSDTISGLGGNDTLIGWEGADQIDGGDGDDTASGGAGDDRIVGGSGLDGLAGDDGDDLIQGGDGNDAIDGGDDDDRLEGGSGADRFLASTGDDVILGGSGGDILDFAALNAAIAANLATGLASYANGLGSASFSSITTLSGDLAADNLVGDGRANRLLGQAGNDTLKGADGNDTLTGGLGRDAMTGGTGADSFDFNLATETGTTAGTRDIVTDFAHLIDLIDLATIDAIAGGSNNAFTFIGTGAFTAAGQVRVVQSGADTIVEANTGGTLAADATILLSNVTATTLAAVDFVL